MSPGMYVLWTIAFLQAGDMLRQSAVRGKRQADAKNSAYYSAYYYVRKVGRHVP